VESWWQRLDLNQRPRAYESTSRKTSKCLLDQPLASFLGRSIIWDTYFFKWFRNLFDPVMLPDFTCGGGLGSTLGETGFECKVLRSVGVLCVVR
jgi:hypothetical protein